MTDCEHHWLDDTEHWNHQLIQAAARCGKCGEFRIQPFEPSEHVTLRVSLVEDLTEGLQEPLPACES